MRAGVGRVHHARTEFVVVSFQRATAENTSQNPSLARGGPPSKGERRAWRLIRPLVRVARATSVGLHPAPVTQAGLPSPRAVNALVRHPMSFRLLTQLTRRCAARALNKCAPFRNFRNSRSSSAHRRRDISDQSPRLRGTNDKLARVIGLLLPFNDWSRIGCYVKGYPVKLNLQITPNKVATHSFSRVLECCEGLGFQPLVQPS